MSLKVEYNFMDRLVHRIAFAGPAVQITAADLESRIFKHAYGHADSERPIFITSLPRSGTTLLLQSLHLFPSLASQLYRDMPFVLAPILWSRVSRPYQKRMEIRERAHKDGVQVGFDSPEGFEEIFWQAFWPEKYTSNRIALWKACDNKAEAHRFFNEHIKKVITLRRPSIRDARYISKNNSNIARLDLIFSMYPEARTVVPVREPLEHAHSLLRQHRNFSDLHRIDPFIRKYMADLGHYEFGALHRPIAFPCFEVPISKWDPFSLEYWLSYWVAAFAHLSEYRDKIYIFPYEQACRDACIALTKLCRYLEVSTERILPIAASLYRAQPEQRIDRSQVNSELRERAESLYASLITDI